MENQILQPQQGERNETNEIKQLGELRNQSSLQDKLSSQVKERTFTYEQMQAIIARAYGYKHQEEAKADALKADIDLRASLPELVGLSPRTDYGFTLSVLQKTAARCSISQSHLEKAIKTSIISDEEVRKMLNANSIPLSNELRDEQCRKKANYFRNQFADQVASEALRKLEEAFPEKNFMVKSKFSPSQYFIPFIGQMIYLFDCLDGDNPLLFNLRRVIYKNGNLSSQKRKIVTFEFEVEGNSGELQVLIHDRDFLQIYKSWEQDTSKKIDENRRRNKIPDELKIYKRYDQRGFSL